MQTKYIPRQTCTSAILSYNYQILLRKHQSVIKSVSLSPESCGFVLNINEINVVISNRCAALRRSCTSIRTCSLDLRASVQSPVHVHSALKSVQMYSMRRERAPALNGNEGSFAWSDTLDPKRAAALHIINSA